MNSIFLISSIFFALFVSLRLRAVLARSCAETQRDKGCKGILDHGCVSLHACTRIGIALSILVLIGGCATVKPWQREALADPIMQADRNPMQTALLDHVYFSREAASGGRSVGGGGCGCN